MKNKIFAIDVKDKKIAIKYVKELKKRNDLTDEIFAIKIGLHTLLYNSLSIIRKIKRISGLDIVCDLKLAEIPSISGEIAKQVFDAGADGIVIQGFVGEKIIDQIQEVAPYLKIYVVSEMTHNDAGFTHAHLKEFADIAKKKRVFAIIGPGNRPQKLKEIKDVIKNEVKLVATGIYKQGGEEVDALKAGADYLIEGSKIREILDQADKKKWKIFLLQGGLYFLLSFILCIVLLNLAGTRLAFITQTPLLNILVPTFFAIATAAIRIFISKKYD